MITLICVHLSPQPTINSTIKEVKGKLESGNGNKQKMPNECRSSCYIIYKLDMMLPYNPY